MILMVKKYSMGPLLPLKVTQFVLFSLWPLAICCGLPLGLNFHLYADDAPVSLILAFPYSSRSIHTTAAAAGCCVSSPNVMQMPQTG